MKRFIHILLVLSLILIFAGCSNENNEANENNDGNASNVNEVENNEKNDSNNEENEANNEAASEAFITVTDLQGNIVELDKVPENIVSLSAGDLETIYALGGEAVGRPVIRGEVADYYKDVTEVGTTNAVNMEVIASLNPDLVIAHPQLNASSIPLLKEMGVDVIVTGANSIDQIKNSIEVLGQALQKGAEAEQLINDINAKIESIKEDSIADVRTLVVFGVPGNWMVALPDSLSGNMLEAVGGTNIARDYPSLDRFPQYANLDAEKIVEADPELILLVTPADTGNTSAVFSKDMKASPVWESITAVKNGNIVTLPNELFGASPGAKIVDSLEYLHNEIKAVAK